MAETAELALFDAIEEYVARAIDPLQREIAALRGELADRMKGDKGDQGDKGDPGPAAEVDYDLVGNIIAVGIDKAIANAEKPKNGEPGKDAVVDYALIKEFIGAAAVNTVAAIPKAKDGEPGKDADEAAIIERVLERIPKPALPSPNDVDQAAIVRDVLAQIPAPPALEPGLQAPEVEAIVARAVAAIPAQEAPVFEPSSIAPLIAEAVESRIKAIEIPPAVVDEAAIAERVRAQLPTVKDGEPGRDFDPELMRAEIGRLFAEMPKAEPGESVHPDTVALMVRDAVAEQLKSVRLPQDGKPGRDALDLEIVESIEQGKSYPAGTFALHDGGTVLATRDTDPLDGDLAAAGWKVTQDGIKDVVREDCDDERITRVVVRSTSGRRFVVDCVTASGMVDQGVHRPGMKYRAGDCVTFDESYWTARRDTAKSPPGEDWRLILKGKRRA